MFSSKKILFSNKLAGSLTWVQKGQDIDGEAEFDLSGHSVSISSDGNTVAIGAWSNDVNGNASGHVRVYNYNGSSWIQKGQDIDGEAANDWSGYSVSISSDGNTVAIGAPYNDGNGSNSGHVRVYNWNGSNWTQKGQDIDGEAADDNSGQSVSLSSDGNTVAIGAPHNDENGYSSGHVRVYSWNGSDWVQKGIDIDGEAAGEWSGTSVSLSSDGNTVAIGAPYNDGNGSNSGHVRVYNWNGSNWIQKGQDIDGEAANDNSGQSVSLSSDGNTVAIGAPHNDENGTDSGHVRVYNYNGSSWIQLGSDIDGEAAEDWSGASVSVSDNGNTVAIGAARNHGINGIESGHVRVYNYNGSNWVQLGQDIDGEAVIDHSGHSVSLSSDGNTVAIGAFYNDENGTNSGHVRVYNFTTPTTPTTTPTLTTPTPTPTYPNWIQLGQDIDGEAADDWSGVSVSLSSDGNTVAIGAYLNDENGTDSGHVRVYNYNGSSWIQLGSDIDGEAANDWSGDSASVSVSDNGNTVAIGAAGNDGINGIDSGHVRVYNYNGSNWVQLGQDIDGEAVGDRSGASVSLSSDGNTVAIGAFFNNGPVTDGIDDWADSTYLTGHVRVYSWNGSSWVQKGQDIDGEADGDLSGWSVSISSDGNTVAIGAYHNDVNGNASGHVRVYNYNGSSWIQKGQDIDGEAANDYSGYSVSISSDGNTVAIGAPYNGGNGSNSGHVRVYNYNGSNWIQLGSDIDGEAAHDYSGHSVSLSSDGNTVAIGAFYNDENGSSSGHVRVYIWNGSDWVQKGIDIDGEAAGDNSGWSVSLSNDGNIVAIGARANDGNGSQAGHVRVYKWFEN